LHLNLPGVKINDLDHNVPLYRLAAGDCRRGTDS